MLLDLLLKVIFKIELHEHLTIEKTMIMIQYEKKEFK